MVDLSEKSKEEIFREKKEAELREAKRRECEWKRRKDKERKCMIGGTFLKYFEDALLFEAEEKGDIFLSNISGESPPLAKEDLIGSGNTTSNRPAS